jgi:hypothetical protein
VVVTSRKESAVFVVSAPFRPFSNSVLIRTILNI